MVKIGTGSRCGNRVANRAGSGSSNYVVIVRTGELTGRCVAGSTVIKSCCITVAATAGSDRGDWSGSRGCTPCDTAAGVTQVVCSTQPVRVLGTVGQTGVGC